MLLGAMDTSPAPRVQSVRAHRATANEELNDSGAWRKRWLWYTLDAIEEDVHAHISLADHHCRCSRRTLRASALGSDSRGDDPRSSRLTAGARDFLREADLHRSRGCHSRRR